ncbi:MAG: hypothetical protein ABL984_14195 [Pyrinomonadaceae bacterium]
MSEPTDDGSLSFLYDINLYGDTHGIADPRASRRESRTSKFYFGRESG